MRCVAILVNNLHTVQHLSLSTSQGDQKKKLAQQLKFQKRSDKRISIDKHVAVSIRVEEEVCTTAEVSKKRSDIGILIDQHVAVLIRLEEGVCATAKASRREQHKRLD